MIKKRMDDVLDFVGTYWFVGFLVLYILMMILGLFKIMCLSNLNSTAIG